MAVWAHYAKKQSSTGSGNQKMAHDLKIQIWKIRQKTTFPTLWKSKNGSQLINRGF